MNFQLYTVSMYIITTITIYRNKFQKSQLSFSINNFSVGSIIFVPFPSKEKPAVILDIDNLENKKSFIRRNKIKIVKAINNLELPIFRKETIDIIKTASEKTKYPIEEILQKIISKNIIQEMNKLNLFSNKDDLNKIKKEIDQISIEFIKNKLKTENNHKKKKKDRLETIGSIVSQKSFENKKTSLHSEKHFLVNEIRNYFGETAKKGKGSFGFYLGFFNRVPKYIIYEYWAEIKQSRKSIKNQQKIFWWKIGQYIKNSKCKPKNKK